MIGPASSWSSPDGVRPTLKEIPLEKLHPHPANPNVMGEDQLEKLARNIEREGVYPPIIARPHPIIEGAFQILDGEQRLNVLPRLGARTALCFIWDCNDATALVLLATLNRLRGEDVPARRAALLAELDALLPRDLLESLLPENAESIEATLALLDLDTERLLADLTSAAERRTDEAPRLISFAVLPEDESIVERAIEAASASLDGPNRRGRALAAICRRYFEVIDA